MIQDETPEKPKLGQPFKPAHRPAVFTGGPVNFQAAATPIIDELGLQSARESTIEEAPAVAIPADDKATVVVASPEPIAAPATPAVTWYWGCPLEPSAAWIAHYASLPSHMPGRRLPVITLD